ncbi:hypothetical protein BT69DRAFT_238501 [Atractiella rhizophila]|nr:hypothetical protein BT69DRAFT_238501 [Atractiella rhizophila]
MLCWRYPKQSDKREGGCCCKCRFKPTSLKSPISTDRRREIKRIEKYALPNSHCYPVQANKTHPYKTRKKEEKKRNTYDIPPSPATTSPPLLLPLLHPLPRPLLNPPSPPPKPPPSTPTSRELLLHFRTQKKLVVRRKLVCWPQIGMVPLHRYLWMMFPVLIG